MQAEINCVSMSSAAVFRSFTEQGRNDVANISRNQSPRNRINIDATTICLNLVIKSVEALLAGKRLRYKEERKVRCGEAKGKEYGMLALGLYEQVVNRIIRANLEQLDRQMNWVEKHKIDSAESSKILAEYMGRLIRQVLDYVSGDESQVLRERVDLCNSVINYVVELIEKGECGFTRNPHVATLVKDHIIHQDAMMLLALADKQTQLRQGTSRHSLTERPETSLAENSLFTGGPHEPSMGAELKKEIIHSDRSTS